MAFVRVVGHHTAPNLRSALGIGLLDSLPVGQIRQLVGQILGRVGDGQPHVPGHVVIPLDFGDDRAVLIRREKHNLPHLRAVYVRHAQLAQVRGLDFVFLAWLLPLGQQRLPNGQQRRGFLLRPIGIHALN